ncbi:MAG: GGDEF domain-containing protein [Candidatus Eisenbacteria bacterium]|uniref:GGDEF domain-containing protein n=1 Tax=Eiseniibacteriota bacterium TaxID=2212470 RepID=A0A849SI82_UNCEI|nr:GGDEF domain-containing protein [Candidatus Eisenbacteria bacterium]
MSGTGDARELERSEAGSHRHGDADARGGRRRAARSLWSACEALLQDDGRAVNRALDDLAKAFDCDGVAIHLVGRDGTLEPWSARGAWKRRAGDLRDCLAVPMMRGEERVGVLDLVAHAGRRWSPAQFALVRTAAGALGAALGARIELRRLRTQPGRDTLTGLPDGGAFRIRLGAELQRARRAGEPVAVVVLDLDRFGALRKRYGAAVANRVLAEVALVLRLTLRESDVLARLGSDTFVALLPDADAGPARRCAERLMRALEDHAFARVGALSASCGVAASPRSGRDALELLNHAEAALDVAKKSGRRRSAVAEAGVVH